MAEDNNTASDAASTDVVAQSEVDRIVDGETAFNEAKEWYDASTKILRERWENKISMLRIPASPMGKDILQLVSKVDELGNDVALDLSKAKSIRTALKDRIDTAKAVYKYEITSEHPDWKPAQIRDAVMVRIAREALQESFNIADAKFNYMQSVADRLKRKKEMLATDRDVMQLSRGLHTPRSDS